MAYRILMYILAFLLSAGAAFAQPDRSEVRRGNRDFRKGDMKEAEIDYRKALVKDSSSVAANYNLANTLYKMGDMEQAAKVYDNIRETAPESEIAAGWHYNRGNVASERKDWQTAVDSYRQSLLLNPSDIDAKENYIYAKEMLKNQQNQQDQQNRQDQQDQQDRQDQQDQQDRNKDDGDNGQQNQSPQDRDGDEDRDEGRGNREPEITPQAAQQMLQAIQAKEKETQEKVKKEKAALLKSRQKEKNW